MENPFIKPATFTLCLRGKKDFGQEFSCLGEQLVQILTCILDETVACNWFVFDLEFGGHQSREILFPIKDDVGVCHIEKTDDLIQKAKQVHQFSSGVFVAIKKGITSNWNPDWLPETEEKEGLQHPDAEIEIRAFDYTCFEIYCTNAGIEEKLTRCFVKSDTLD